MPNKNYRAGRRVEYEVMKQWKESGHQVVRTAGSHGLFDVIAFKPEYKPVFIQCKRTTSQATAKRLITEFKKATIPAAYYYQVLHVKVKGGGDRETVSTLI